MSYVASRIIWMKTVDSVKSDAEERLGFGVSGRVSACGDPAGAAVAETKKTGNRKPYTGKDS